MSSLFLYAQVKNPRGPISPKRQPNGLVLMTYYNDGGFGAFATRSFEKEEIVGDYVGEKLTLREKDARYLGREQNWRDKIWLASRRARGVTASGTYIFQVDDDLFVDAEDPVHANWCRYINHHNDPNMRVKSLAYAFGGEPRVWFVATRDIAPGEELSFDYGDEYWVETDTHVVDQ